MRIEAVMLHGADGAQTLQWNDVHAGLNAVFGAPQSAKTQTAELLAHVLFGRPPAEWQPASRRMFPAGEVVVQRGNRRYRLRRHDDGPSTPRLTVTALDGIPADHGTIQAMVGGLSPTVLAPLCAVSFSESPAIAPLLSLEFARELYADGERRPMYAGRRAAELAARRDLLAQELETRIASERRASKELDGRWRELDRLVRDEQHRAKLCDERLRAAETALAETDTRLRYRRLELNVQLRWHADEPEDCSPQVAELGQQIAQSRSTLAELGQREAQVRTRLAQSQTSGSSTAAALVDQRAWLSVARQLAADLTGEVARLARATASQECVCRDAHPRLRPVAETIERQLDVLENLIEDQTLAVQATELQQEVETLARMQSELRRYLDNLLERRQVLVRGIRPSRPAISGPDCATRPERECDVEHRGWLCAADAQQLEERRAELEQDRFELAEQMGTHNRTLRDLRAQRETVERQRAAVLSARSIEHVQRELADVQRKLEQAAIGIDQHEHWSLPPNSISRASDFLAQLSDGAIVQLTLVDYGRRARVVTRGGETLAVEALPAAQSDLVYLSLCLGLLTCLAQRGIWLPLVLDEPFLRLDAHGTAALAVVLDDFCRRGHQVLVFTSQSAASERLRSIGAATRDVSALQTLGSNGELPIHATGKVVVKNPKAARQETKTRRKKLPTRKPLQDDKRAADQSDAA